jgi:hypothetical protein
LDTSNGKLEVEFEFPWTIRNAVLDFDSSLISSQSKSEMLQGVKRYLRHYFVIENEAGENLKITKLQERSNGSSHHYIIMATYSNNNTVQKIDNHLMHNISKEHVSYHYFKPKTNSPEWKTTYDKPRIVFYSSSSQSGDYIITLSLIIIAGFIWFFKIKSR